MRDREVRFIKSTIIGYSAELVKDIFGGTALVLAAHPDDEVIGAGALYRYLEKAVFLHFTDGAPKNKKDANANGFKTSIQYAAARRQEKISALSLSGVKPENMLEACVPDQEAVFNLKKLTLQLKELLMSLNPESVLTMPYEGGHPDHDSVSFCANAAFRLLRSEGLKTPPLIEYAMYHLSDGKFAASEFLPREGFESITVILTAKARKLKKEMFEMFSTQKGALNAFPVECEMFRQSPDYDYSEPLHKGRLYYENFNWGVDGRGWRELAGKALDELGLKRGL